jgi:uncharacterized protein
MVDTGPFVAAADRSDRHHQPCRELLETAPGPLVTTPLVVAEVVYLVSRELGPHVEPAFYDAILDGTVVVENLNQTDWRRIRTLVEQYRDLPLGGTDASVIAVAERLGVTSIATLDRAHFLTVRPVHCDAFGLVPSP